jgi:AraC-like DNA-binding protein
MIKHFKINNLYIFPVFFVSFFFIILFPDSGIPEVIFKEDFESGKSVPEWLTVLPHGFNDWAEIKNNFGFENKGGIRIKAGEAHFLSKSLLWTRDSDFLLKGFYFEFQLRFNPPPETSTVSGGNQTAGILGFVIESEKRQTTYNPRLVVEKMGDNNYCLRLRLRKKKLGTPKSIPPKASFPLQLSKWHKVKIFIRIKDNELLDSLFINDNFVGAESTRFSYQLGNMSKWDLGLWQQAPDLGIGSVDYDNILISDWRSAESPIKPRITSPGPHTVVTEPFPEFRIDEVKDDSTRSIQLQVFQHTNESSLSKNQILIDSLQTVKPVIKLNQTLKEGVIYGYRARYRDSLGNDGPWERRGPFLILKSLHRPGALKPENVRIEVTPDLKGDYSFAYEDTVKICLHFEPLHENLYIDLNLSSAAFKGDRKSRWGVHKKAENLTFSLSIAENEVYSKHKEDNQWFAKINPASKDKGFPYNTLVLDSLSMNDQKGRVNIPLILNKELEPGTWTVNAYLVDDKGNISQFPSRFFFIEPLTEKRCNILCTAAAFILPALLVIILILMIRRRKKGSRFPDSWVNIVGQVEQYLNENYSEELKNESIAKIANLSRRRLFTIYSKVKGKSPVQHLKEIRIQRACELLKSSSDSVSEIGYKVGFSDPNIFLKNFKKQVGMSPSQFREK